MVTPDIEATVTYLTAEEGGRHTPFSTGYRGAFYYRGELHVAVHEYPGIAMVYPGQTVTVILRFLHPEVLHRHIRPGDQFEIREASQIVAKGRVTKIVDLVAHAEDQKS